MKGEEVEFEPGLAIYAETGIVDNPYTGETMAYLEISQLGHDGETTTLRLGLEALDGLKLAWSLVRYVVGAKLPWGKPR